MMVAVLAGGLPAGLAAQGFGLKAGASFGNVSNRGVLPGDLGRRTGLAGGIYIASGSAIGVGVEGLYAQRGLKSDGSSAEETRLDYLDVPIYLKVALPVGGIRPFAYAGPQVSYEVRCRTAGGDPCASQTDRKKFDYAGVIGAGIHIGGGSIGFGLEGRYVYGLQDLKISTITSSESYKTRSFLILASIGK
jgi:hypothetical protein